MKLPKNLTLKTKLIGSFIFLVLLTVIASYVRTQVSLQKITGEVIPPLRIIRQVSNLVKSMHVEALEYIATGDEKALQDLGGYTDELNILLKQSETISGPSSDDTIALENLFLVINEVSGLGQEIIQSRSQTLAHLEALQELEEEVDRVFDEANDVVEAEIARNLQDEDLDELAKDSLPTQQYLKDFTTGVQRLRTEAIEFAASGEEGSLTEFDEIKKQLGATPDELETIIEVDEPGEGDLVSKLDEIKEKLETRSQAVVESHTKTLSLLEELEELEEEIDEIINTTELTVDQEIDRQLTEINNDTLISSGVMLGLAVFFGLVIANTL